jgi:hypothetical protein
MAGSLIKHRNDYTSINDVYILLVRKNRDVVRDYEIDRMLFDLRREEIEENQTFQKEIQTIDYLSRQLEISLSLYWPGFMATLYRKLLGIDPLFEKPDGSLK